MKCEYITSTWYSTGMGSKVNKIVCGGEMIEVGKINNEGIYEPQVTGGKGYLGLQTLYQCELCKTVKLV